MPPTSSAATPGRPSCPCRSSPISKNSPSTIAGSSPAKTDKAARRPHSIPELRRIRRALGRDRRRFSPAMRSSRARSTNSPRPARVKKGTAEVDAAFLEEIESWRESSPKLALRNAELSASAS